ncbi:MAG: hypothetical protein B7733_23190 [Myxococcales bacterium FL481]|nr:MAG: hypothetical protein B7733_23190 [Myxococcales bacterium FL481]
MNRPPAVFFLTSHGMAGDHWFDWLPKALGSHSEIFVYMGESVRSKYLHERSRKERPDVVAFAEFLFDLGTPYTAIGECFAYRSYQLDPLRRRFGGQVRFANILRDPFCWMEFFVTWRCNNLNQAPGVTTAIDHEWAVARHEEFAALKLRPYSREDVEVWATYQAMHILNRMKTDEADNVVNYRMEDMVGDPRRLQELVAWLTQGRIEYDRAALEAIYSWVDTPWRAGARVLADPAAIRQQWPEWKHEAFAALVTQATRERFSRLGYGE